MVNLVETIFEQFLDIVEKKSRKSCYEFDECDFNFRVIEAVKHKLLIVLFEREDKCCRRHEVTATIDITNICFEDLTSCDWIAYLKKIAVEFVNDICPKKFVIVKDKPKKCRERPHVCEPFPCKTITTVIKKRVPPKVEEECKVIFEEPCPCGPKCKRVHCPPKKEIIIQLEDEKPWKCGDHTVFVDEHKDVKHHDFGEHKGHKDWNHHLWHKKCDEKKDCRDSCRKKFCNNFHDDNHHNAFYHGFHMTH